MINNLEMTHNGLEGGPSQRQFLLVVSREKPEWRRDTTKGTLIKDIQIPATVQPMFQFLRTHCSAMHAGRAA